MADEAKSTIYIVDDDDAVRGSLELLLQSYGFEVEGFSSVAEFSDAALANGNAAGRSACIILDLHLPGTSGLDYLSSRNPGSASMPVIIISGRGDTASRVRAGELGVSAFLDKPVRGDILVAEIRQVLASL